MTTATRTAIALEIDCRDGECRSFAEPLLSQLVLGRYDECSVLDLDGLNVREWLETHRTFRKRASRAARPGYVVSTFRRDRYADDIFAINTSLERRQGRPMTAGYRERPSETPDPESACRRHEIRPYGVFAPDEPFPLVAYAIVLRAGELALVSQILGHGAYLDDGIMFALMKSVLELERDDGGFLVYNRHDSGTAGLRQFKEWIGFEAREVEWLA